MPPLKPLRFYWDSNVFLDYFNETPGKFPDINTILADIRASQEQYKIITSVLTISEVAYIAEEKIAPDKHQNVEARLDELWTNIRMIDIVEVNEFVAREARRLTRIAFLNGWHGIRSHDAVHLASALYVQKHVEVIAFHTYNLKDFQNFRSEVSFRIEEPRPTQLQLLAC